MSFRLLLAGKEYDDNAVELKAYIAKNRFVVAVICPVKMLAVQLLMVRNWI